MHLRTGSQSQIGRMHGEIQEEVRENGKRQSHRNGTAAPWRALH
jgi:hypothetical protein